MAEKDSIAKKLPSYAQLHSLDVHRHFCPALHDRLGRQGEQTRLITVLYALAPYILYNNTTVMYERIEGSKHCYIPRPSRQDSFLPALPEPKTWT